jgi:hypothetical protein
MAMFTWNRCNEFAAMAQAHLARMKDQETKLTYAINRVIGRIQKQQPTVSDVLADIEIDHCITEKRGNQDVIARDAQGNLQFTKESIKKRYVETRKYLNEANVEIEPYFATVLPNDLSVFEIEAFTGFVISDEDSQRLLAECEARADVVLKPNDNGHLRQVSAIAT